MWSNKVFRYSIITIGSLLVLGYLAMVITSIDTYYPGTKINGIDCGFKSPDYVDTRFFYSKPSEYNLEIKFREKTEKLTGVDVGLQVDYRDRLDEIKAGQNPFLWFKTFWDNVYTVDKRISFDEKLLDSRLENMDELNPENMVEPENPSIELNDDGVVEAIAGNPGNVIEDTDKLYDIVADAIYNTKTKVDIEKEGLYKESEYNVDSAKVRKCVEYCNKIAGLDAGYYYGDYKVPIEPFQLFGTISMDENYNASISKFKVYKMLEGFSRMHDTFGKTRRFKNHYKQIINVTGAKYGWKINIEEETEELYNDLIRARDISRSPVFENEGFVYDNKGNDIGDFYAEVDISNQHMYLYKNKRIVLDSDVVTGCLNAGHGTPGGIYYIYYKQSPAVLKGEDYESNVTYWMPFNGGIGFHDATWRGRFGGDIYVYAGSHGCVNMPYNAAQEMFGIVEEYMPVIVY